MLTLPRAAEPLMMSFSVAFSKPSFQRAVTLMIGAILAMGRRTVTNVLWTVRLIADGHFSSDHRLFSRASWSLWPLGKALATAVLAWIPEGQPVVVFNIAHNRYRLIAAEHYNTRIVYTLMILTHREYDRDT